MGAIAGLVGPCQQGTGFKVSTSTPSVVWHEAVGSQSLPDSQGPRLEAMMQPVRAFLDAISRQFRRWPVGLVLLVHTVAALVGCTQLNPTRTGYLTDYSQLQVTEKRVP